MKTPPMPKVAELQIYLPDMQQAIARAQDAWNMAQFVDAINSVQFFLLTIQSRIVKS
jgi:hypothetical protein